MAKNSLGKSKKLGRRSGNRQGAYLVLFALSMTLFIGLLALIHDLALINYGWRRCQNIADAAALAGARKLGSTRSPSNAKNTALVYLTILNQTDSTLADIRTPPTSGDYAGQRGYVQVTARWEIGTWMLRRSWFSSPSIEVTAQSVAGDEMFIPEPSLLTLNPQAFPGLAVSRTSAFRVHGRIMVNSEGGGLDEYGNPIGNGNSSSAISVGLPTSNFGIFSDVVDSVGGVDNPYGIKPRVQDAYAPVRTKVPPFADPFLSIATPSVSNGVDNRFRGSVTVTSTSVSGLAYDTSGLNRVAKSNEVIAGGLYTANAGDIILHPGIYTRIWISGGRVFFVPGIYVVTARVTSPEVLRITGGSVVADGLMFYATGANYDANTGAPDRDDTSVAPPALASTTFGPISLVASFRASPIDTRKYDYASLYPGGKAVASEFNGITFYQRRHNQQYMAITGTNNQLSLSGVFYGKWMPLRISATGVLGAKFVVSSLNVLGGSSIEILATETDSPAIGRSIFLVE
jgi:hypothetical protein